MGTTRSGEFDPSLTKEGSVPPVEPTEAQRPIVGTWLGAMETSAGLRLRLVFNIDPAADGGLSATMDSPDQGASGIPISEESFAGDHLRLFSSTVGGTFEGDLSENGKILMGTWMQGGMEIPLSLKRTEEAVQPPARPKGPKPRPEDCASDALAAVAFL